MQNHYLAQRIRIKKRSLSQTEQKIADYFIDSDEQLSKKTLEELAYEIAVSQSSIYQFVKSLGYRGFQDFKIDIARNFHYQPTLQNLQDITDSEGIHSDDSSLVIAQKVLQSNVYALSNSLNFLTEELLNSVLALMYSAKNLHFFGVGGSSIVAFDSFHKFNNTTYHCNYIFDYHIQLSLITKFTSDDCIFLFSHSGQTNEVINLARKIKKTSATMIVLTGNSGSELVTLANQAITVLTEELLFTTEALASRISYLTIMDILYANVVHQNYEENLASMKKIHDNISTTKTTSDDATS